MAVAMTVWVENSTHTAGGGREGGSEKEREGWRGGGGEREREGGGGGREGER